MQITFNTEDSLEDLKNIHELIINAIKKKGEAVTAQVPQNQIQTQQAQTTAFMSNPGPPTVSRLANSPFASMLKAEQSSSLGSPVHTISKVAPVQNASSGDARGGTIAKINEDYRRQYEENKQNPKPKGQNPEIDMTNIFMSDAGRREGRRLK